MTTRREGGGRKLENVPLDTPPSSSRFHRIQISGLYKNRSEPANPDSIGTPYKGMTAARARVWKECATNMPWLNAPHRLLLRQVCILAARMETGKDLSVSSTHALSAMLSKLGRRQPMNPRSAIHLRRRTRTNSPSTEGTRRLPMAESIPTWTMGRRDGDVSAFN